MAIHADKQDRDGMTARVHHPGGPAFTIALLTLVALALSLLMFKLLSQTEVASTERMLEVAVETGDLQAARTAIAQGASVNHRDWTGATPLHTAAWRGDLAMARLLIDAGARINVLDDRSGETPLHSAARGAEPAMLVFLLEAGADPRARTHSDNEQCNGTLYPAGVTAFEIARLNGLSRLDHILDEQTLTLQ
jgi:ankyrin repeat protein